MNRISITRAEKEPSFLQIVNDMSGEKVQLCYQCVKCSAGCPLVAAMDFNPNQIMKMIQLGMKMEVLSSSSLWLCASCETCSVRCPNELNIPGVMLSLREIALKEGYEIKEKNIEAFHKAFLSMLRNDGRISEFYELASYKMKTAQFFKDLGLGIKMLRKGRLSLKHNRIENTEDLNKIFENLSSES
ncbi:MAG: 4Fe-4S dicluster domain-containing protein [Fidelibacterota bacterium]